MKYIAQYLQKLTPDVIVTHSKTTESVYYDFGYGFIVRLSDHLKSSTNKTPTISITQVFNSDGFIVQVEQSPYPLLKTRTEAKEMVKNALQIYTLKGKTKKYLEKKSKATLDEHTEWSAYWSNVCLIYPSSRFFSKEQKAVLRRHFEGGLKGSVLFDAIKRIKNEQTAESIDETLCGLERGDGRTHVLK